MKIRDLVEELKRYPQDWDVVLASDEEGNDFHLSYDASAGWYDEEERGFSSQILSIELDANEIYRDRTTDECNSLCIWP